MKTTAWIALIVVMLVCGGCASHKERQPVHAETRDFDMDTAVKMVLHMEKPIIELAAKSQVTRQELKETSAQAESLFHDHGSMIVHTFFDVADVENMDMDEIDLYPYNFYPTVYHRGIEITEAEVTVKEYEEPFFSRTFLRIREEYTGDDPLLAGFYRESVFEWNGEEWVFISFDGTVNYQGEDYHANLLALNE